MNRSKNNDWYISQAELASCLWNIFAYSRCIVHNTCCCQLDEDLLILQNVYKGLFICSSLKYLLWMRWELNEPHLTLYFVTQNKVFKGSIRNDTMDIKVPKCVSVFVASLSSWNCSHSSKNCVLGGELSNISRSMLVSTPGYLPANF